MIEETIGVPGVPRMRQMLRTKVFRSILAMVFFALIGIQGCGGHPKQEPPTPGTQEIRGDSDQFFQKMDQEEKSQLQQQPKN